MRVTEKGQVTIPKAIRDHLGIRAGSEVHFVREGDVVRLTGATRPGIGDVKNFEDWASQVAGTINTQGRSGREHVDWLRGERDDRDAH